jgi:hypothetical protein
MAYSIGGKNTGWQNGYVIMQKRKKGDFPACTRQRPASAHTRSGSAEFKGYFSGYDGQIQGKEFEWYFK